MSALTPANSKDFAAGSVSRSTSAGSSGSSNTQSPQATPERSGGSSAAQFPEIDYPVPFVIQRSPQRGDKNARACAPAKASMQKYDYPAPVVVKNTFLDSPAGAPFSSLDQFQPQRAGSCFAMTPPGLQVEHQYVQSSAPLLVKNTFLNAPVETPVSLDGFFNERLTHSAPVSAMSVPPGLETPPFSPPGLFCEPAVVETPLGSLVSEFLPSTTPFGSSVFEYPKMETFVPPLLPPALAPGALPASFAMPPPPPFEWAPSNFSDMCPPPPLQAAPSLEALTSPSTPPPRNPASIPVASPPKLLRIADSLPQVKADVAALPSVGSNEHAAGTCKPCAFLYTKGCQNGVQCEYCHLCPPGEKKRRQRAKFAALAEDANRTRQQ